LTERCARLPLRALIDEKGPMPLGRLHTWVLRVVTGVVPAVLALAACAKLMDWEAFVASLGSFSLVHPALRSTGMVLVPAVEVVPLLVYCCGYPRAANRVALIVLSVFTALLVWHWAHNVKPQCACFGAWVHYEAVEESGRVLFTRNALLIGAAISGSIIRGPSAMASRSRP